MNPVDTRAIIEELTAQPLGVGMFLAGAGIVFLLLGHRIFRALIGVSFGGIGYLLGASLGTTDAMQIVLGLVVGAALGTASVCFIRAAVAILTGGWCGLIAFQFFSQLSLIDYVLAAIVLFAAAAAISLTFIMYDEIIAFITSLEGSFLCLASIVIMFSHSAMLWSHIRDLLVSNAFFGPFLVLTGTVTGFYFQLADLRHKNTGTHM